MQTQTAHRLRYVPDPCVRPARFRLMTAAGPVTIALAQRWNMDSCDQGEAVRTDVLSRHDGIWDCVVIGECSVVCPKNVDPSLAIQQYKPSATKPWFRSFLLPRHRR